MPKLSILLIFLLNIFIVGFYIFYRKLDQFFYCFIIFSDVNVKFRTCVHIPKCRFDEEVLNDLLEHFNQSFVQVFIILLKCLYVHIINIYIFILNKLLFYCKSKIYLQIRNHIWTYLKLLNYQHTLRQFTWNVTSSNTWWTIWQMFMYVSTIFF